MTTLNVRRIIGAGLQNTHPSDSIIEHIMWERTAYPVKEMSAKEIYKAANRFKRANDNEITLCIFCDNKADETYECTRCSNALEKVRNES